MRRNNTLNSNIAIKMLKLVTAAYLLTVCVSAAGARYDENILKNLNKEIRDNRIEHVVVLMLENRSFDHILGRMNSAIPELDGLKGDEKNYWDLKDQRKGFLTVKNNTYWRAPLDPEHTILDSNKEIFGLDKVPTPYPKTAPMNGFAHTAAELITKGPNITECRQHVMSAWPADSLPITHTLAKEFAVFDRWFASMPGPTLPNRQYLHAATSNGVTDHLYMKLVKGYQQKTIYQNLNKKKIDWKIYFHDFPLSMTMTELRSSNNLRNFLLIDRFYQHARENKLPKYSILEPGYHDFKNFPANDNHPPHSSAAAERFIKRVYETLRASPAWNKTLLVITYDENGGYYDHVSPPMAGVPSPDGVDGNKGEAGAGFRFDRLGIRVPTILVSPWLRRGSVYHEAQGPQPTSQFEHSSIPGFLKRHFQLDNYLTKRDEWAGAIEPALTELTKMRTDCPTKLPSIASDGTWNPNSPIGDNKDDEGKSTPEDPAAEDDGYTTTEAHFVGKEVKELIDIIRHFDRSGRSSI
ncbi:phosphoesterase family-domain-containing protein [Syncephalis fuscata]|nr:phosphoesterase family-domain-containing protein [Syncephalis fuscata]